MSKSLTKTQLIGEIASKVDLPKSQVQAVFDSLSSLIEKELKGRRPVVIPGLAKVLVHHKKATHDRDGRNPSTGEAMRIKGKPARDVVKVRPIKALKDMI